MTPDLFGAPVMRCAFCRKWGAPVKVRCNPPDDSTEIHRWFCDTTCLAKFETNQERPAA